jgi:hypothetical protein
MAQHRATPPFFAGEDGKHRPKDASYHPTPLRDSVVRRSAVQTAVFKPSLMN